MRKIVLMLAALGILSGVAYAQLRSDTLFPWSSGLAIPGLQIGIQGPNAANGTPMAIVLHGTCGVTFGSVGVGLCTTGSCAAAGVATTDRVFAQLTTDFPTASVATCGQSAVLANAITIKCCNPSAGAITPGTGTFGWMAIRP